MSGDVWVGRSDCRRLRQCPPHPSRGRQSIVPMMNRPNRMDHPHPIPLTPTAGSAKARYQLQQSRSRLSLVVYVVLALVFGALPWVLWADLPLHHGGAHAPRDQRAHAQFVQFEQPGFHAARGRARLRTRRVAPGQAQCLGLRLPERDRARSGVHQEVHRLAVDQPPGPEVARGVGLQPQFARSGGAGRGPRAAQRQRQRAGAAPAFNHGNS